MQILFIAPIIHLLGFKGNGQEWSEVSLFLEAKMELRAIPMQRVAVMLAEEINIPIFKPLWLKQNEILKEEEFTDKTVITPVVNQFPNKKFQLDIWQNRVQIMFSQRGFEDSASDLERIFGGIVTKLPHTPYTAIGYTFLFAAVGAAIGDFARWNHEHFIASCVPKEKVDDSARFGCYFSNDELGMRLRVDIKPAKNGKSIPNITPAIDPDQEFMLININLEHNIDESGRPDEIIQTLKKWSDAVKIAEEIAEKMGDLK